METRDAQVQPQPQAPTIAEPQEQHRWLQKLVGEWTYEGEASMGPDQPPEKFEGTESVRPLGELWVLGWGNSEMPGGEPATTLITLGYDTQKQRFVGTFIGSMMTNLWVYDGALDADGRVLTLEAEGPSMAGDGTLTMYRDVIEMKSDDHRVLSSHSQGEDGQWQQFMEAHYRRTG